MNKQVFALAVSTALSAAFAQSASAQTSVTLYGVLDEGINYTNNVGRGHVYELASGDAQGSRWGLKGAEELGGGLKAIFQLENGFDVNSGRLNQGGRMFGRQAFVGISSDTFGSLTFGRQYDSVVDYLAQTTANGNWGRRTVLAPVRQRQHRQLLSSRQLGQVHQPVDLRLPVRRRLQLQQRH
ncbi:putative porin [Paraburkholderia bryophila]|uniref:Putative porin n=1 Tax=Paraburkholderia bryophila TaxID=420952 RepID=A0A7Y9WAA5_9BURK|nr:putative porin [Paraburkholderia bryophila]